MPELEQDADLSAFVAEKAKEHRVPGLAVGVLHGDRAYAATHGVTSTTDQLEVDADTLFMIGSTSKTLTATALMALVDQGRLTLTDRVLDHLPDFRVADSDATRTVTVGQLLNHTAGWQGDALPSTGYGDDALARALDVVAAGPQEFPPGQHTSYNNGALLVAGRIVEVLTGSTYEQAVTDLVLTPLEMTNTFFLPWEVAPRRAAVGHVLHPDRAEPHLDWPMKRGMAPAGGAASSLRDQLFYAAYHLDGMTRGTAPLAEETRLLMQQPTAQMRSAKSGVGLSWLLAEHQGVRLVSHGGNVSNLQTSSFDLAPDHRLAVVVMGNSKGGASVGADALAWALQHYLGLPAPSPLPLRPLTSELLEEYAGSYDVGPWLLDVTTADGRLFAQMVLPAEASVELRTLFDKPPSELVLVGPDQLAPATNPIEPTADFVRDAAGAVTWFRSGLRMARRKEIHT